MSGLLIPNTFDPKGKTPNIAYGSTSGTPYIDVLNISGSGYLESVHLGGIEYPCLKVIVDGVTLLDNNIAYSSYSAYAVLVTIFKFKTSLQIQIKNKTNNKPANATVCYLLD